MSREEYLEREERRKSILEQYQALGIRPIMGGSQEEDEELDSDEDDEEQEDDESDDGSDDEESSDEDKAKGRQKGKENGDSKNRRGVRLPKSQAELDRLIERRLARERAKLEQTAGEKARQQQDQERKDAADRKAGKFENILKRREDTIRDLQTKADKVDLYEEIFDEILASEIEGLPEKVIERLMPKNLSPAEQLQWVRDYRETIGSDDDASDDDADEESDGDTAAGASKRRAPARNEASRDANGSRDQAARRKGNTRKPPPKDGKAPKVEDLIKAAREKRRGYTI